MSTYIYNEIWLFVRAFAGGAVLILCYSLLQEIRGLIFCSPAAGGILDLLYWACAGLLVFAGIYRINQGILRSFLFLGIISGAFLTYLTIKPLFEKISTTPSTSTTTPMNPRNIHLFIFIPGFIKNSIIIAFYPLYEHLL